MPPAAATPTNPTTPPPPAQPGPTSAPGVDRGMLVMMIAALILVQSVQTAVTFVIPIIAKKQFAAADWQVLLLTAPQSALFVLSIFWADLFERVRLSRYLSFYWLLAAGAPALIAFAHGYWWLAGWFILACAAYSGFPPVTGGLLKRLFPQARHGRIYAIMTGSHMAAGAAATWAVGRWLEADDQAFRLILPIAAGSIALGCGLLVWLDAIARRRSPAGERRTGERRGGWKSAIDSVTHMRSILRADRVFFRYEAAYMTYGAGWMIGFALLPLILTEKLRLPYDDATSSTQVVYLLALLAALWPAGVLLDRIGAIRSTAISFGMLALYPLGLLAASDSSSLAVVSIFYGIAHAGASMGWMLGPVALAPTPEQAPRYVAIHATLVGVRGALFQGLGVGLYAITGSFALPLTLASAAYAWSAWQMWRLRHAVAKPTRPTRPASPPPSR